MYLQASCVVDRDHSRIFFYDFFFIFFFYECTCMKYREEGKKDRLNEFKKEKEVKCVDEKLTYHLDHASDSLVVALNIANGDNHPNIQKLFEMARNRIGVTEAE